VKATVFLGGGRITSALIAGLRLAKYDLPIVVHDRHPEKLRNLKKQYGVITETSLEIAVEAARWLIVAVRPDSVFELFKKIENLELRRELTVISLAAGVPLAQLERSLGSPYRWARAMPSPICRTGEGLTALAFSHTLKKTHRTEIRNLFALVGSVIEISETQFDAFTVTFSISHGHHALATLIEAAQSIGLDEKTAQLAAAHALGDAISSWRSSGMPLSELLDEAATPGGIAASVIESLNNAGYQRIVENGLRAGMDRARKNAGMKNAGIVTKRDAFSGSRGRDRRGKQGKHGVGRSA
jgi:pyrroline-5-carboxylate reductase